MEIFASNKILQKVKNSVYKIVLAYWTEFIEIWRSHLCWLFSEVVMIIKDHGVEQQNSELSILRSKIYMEKTHATDTLEHLSQQI